MAVTLTVLLTASKSHPNAAELRRRLVGGDWGVKLDVVDLWDMEGEDAQLALVDDADLVVGLSHPSTDVARPLLERIDQRLDADDLVAVLLNGTGAPPRKATIPARFLPLDGDDLERLSRPRRLFRVDESLDAPEAWAQAEEQIRRVLNWLATPGVSEVYVNNLGPILSSSLELSPGITVLLGTNGAGKSWLMKVLYAALQVPAGDAQFEHHRRHIADRLVSLFRPDDDRLGRLVRRSCPTATVRVSREGGRLEFELQPDGSLTPSGGVLLRTRSQVFIPSRESLAMFDGFMPLYNKYGLSFDSTHADLCEHLATPELRAPRGSRATSILADLEAMLGGKIGLKGGHFVRASPDGEIEAHLLSEGQRKVGTLARLLANGVLTRGSVLFWDEPEANMNPRLISRFAELIDKLGSLGVQIILTTHDHLLAQRLSLAAEYGTASTSRQFVSFFRHPDGGFVTETAGTLAELEHNDLLDEHVSLYDDERALALRRLVG